MTSANQRSAVVVIGAGLAGLTAAYRLHQQEIDVAIYEARGRVGGRVLTVEVGGHTAELGGGNLTDGGKVENLYRLIKECGLEIIEDDVLLNYSYFDGKSFLSLKQLLIDRHFNAENLKEELNHLALTSRHMQDVLRGIFREDEPLYQILSVRLAAYEGAVPEKLSPFYVDTLFHMLLGGISSAHPGTGTEGIRLHLASIKGGNALLPEKMAERLGNRLHLNQALKQVSKDEQGTFVLTFSGGEKVKADRLVLAIPCSVYENIVFDENVIPRERLEAIKSVPYGTNAKILVPFIQKPSKREGLINRRVVSSSFHVKGNVLTLYYTGESSRFSEETISQTYGEEQAMIEKGFGEGCFPLFAPRMAEDRPFAHYAGAVGHSWPNDPYAKGSYAYIAPGQESLFTDIHKEGNEIVKTLFAPIDRKLYFAGEHASILLEAMGTLEAACESGERVARLILYN